MTVLAQMPVLYCTDYLGQNWVPPSMTGISGGTNTVLPFSGVDSIDEEAGCNTSPNSDDEMRSLRLPKMSAGSHSSTISSADSAQPFTFNAQQKTMFFHINSIFHACVVAQQSSTELLVYSRELGQLVMIAYPMSCRGQRIVPEGVFDFLRRRGLTWECFCGLISGQPTPARFADEFISGHTVVRCHHVDNRCGFYPFITLHYWNLAMNTVQLSCVNVLQT
ncbi:hypothetical protein F4604DRAFT_1675376 [Suillus subluteus]|nr:hypothetical protein F4604DRAFT_1687813 [Suillus subluteus]KAG1886460.1 hypothetical protein F4604DRAFT_1675376 [Suillus subluteus]